MATMLEIQRNFAEQVLEDGACWAIALGSCEYCPMTHKTCLTMSFGENPTEKLQWFKNWLNESGKPKQTEFDF